MRRPSCENSRPYGRESEETERDIVTLRQEVAVRTQAALRAEEESRAKATFVDDARATNCGHR